MPELTPEGEKTIGEIAERHGVSIDAVKVMLEAVARGGGVMAQFSHPDFGGSGQWLRGGMTMVSDMFNNGLKAKVDALCSELSALLASAAQTGAIFTDAGQSQRQSGTPAGAGASAVSKPFSSSQPGGNWWPAELGAPSSVGSQNDTCYAYFPEKRRLAIHRGGQIEVLDTADHIIHGFGQQQGGGQPISLSSQLGTVPLESLKRAKDARHGEQSSAPAAAASTAGHAAPPSFEPAQSAGQQGSAATILGLVEKLAELRDKGVLSEDEFAAKKAELLTRL